MPEREQYLELLRRAAERQDAQEGKPKRPAIIETTATPVAKTQERANSRAMPIPGAPFVGAK